MADPSNLADTDTMAEKTEITRAADLLSPLSEEEKRIERKLRLKIDTLIMPLVVSVYLLNYIDRNNYAAARLQGLEDDLHLVGEQYQTGLSILFVGYILMQIPSNLILNFFARPSLYLGFWTCAWGLLSALTSQVKSYGGIVACRFLLGFCESPFFAGVIFYLSKWYTKRELALRMSLFYAGSLLSGAFGNLIAAGILDGLAGKRGLTAWQWLYIIEGAMTCAVGVIICFVLPDFPQTWRLLTPEMKYVANRRLAIEAAEADVDEEGGMSQLRGLKLAFTDYRTYVLALAYMCITGAAGFQNFYPTLTKTLGYNDVISLLLVAPPYIFVLLLSLLHSHLSDRYEKRFWFFVYPIPITITGFIVFMATSSFGAKYASLVLMTTIFLQFGTFFSWVSTVIPRPPAKRAVAYAFINAIGNSASIWTPYVYRDQDYPYYRPAMGMNIALQSVGFICAVFLFFNLRHLNKQQARIEDETVELTEKELKRLQHTADVQGVDLETARKMHRGVRFAT